MRYYMESMNTFDLPANGVKLKSLSFLWALLEVTKDHVRSIFEDPREPCISRKDLAWIFRKRMTENQTASAHNAFRENFYRLVIEKAASQLFYVVYPPVLMSPQEEKDMILAQSSPSHPPTKDPDPLRESYLDLALLITSKCMFLEY